MGHQTTIRVGDKRVLTLADILPVEAPMRMLIVAKTPALVSVGAGHYFQGRQGAHVLESLARLRPTHGAAGDS